MRFLRTPDLDLQAAPQEQPRDDHLRYLVDCLPWVERHMVERVHFGQATLTEASEEIGVSRSTGRRLLDKGQAQLREWLESGVTPDEPTEASVVVAPAVKSCKHKESWGGCVQPEVEAGLCASHLYWQRTGHRPHDDYERRVMAGHRSVLEFLNESEMEALVNGRYRGDGRRLDSYVTADPLGWRPS